MNRTQRLISMLKKNKWLTTVLTLIVFVLIFRAGQRLSADCVFLPALNSPWFITAILLACVYRITNAYGWALVLRAMNQPVDRNAAARIWLRAESRRWLPGGVWGYASRATQAEALHVSPTVASASMLVELLLTIVAALFVAVPAALIYRTEFLTSLTQCLPGPTNTWLIALTAVAGVATVIVFRRKMLRRFRSLLNRFDALQGVSLSAPETIKAFVFFVMMGLLNGGVTVLLLWSLPAEAVPATVVIAATSWAWVIGFLAVFAPGGLFVREGIFAVCLAAWLPYETGITLAIVARLIQMGAELVGMIWVSADWRSIVFRHRGLDCAA